MKLSSLRTRAVMALASVAASAGFVFSGSPALAQQSRPPDTAGHHVVASVYRHRRLRPHKEPSRHGHTEAHMFGPWP